MKNIFLLGVSRSGKTTLAKMFREKYPIYQLLDCDSIRFAYKKSLKKFAEFHVNDVGKSCEYQTFISEYYVGTISNNKDLKYILDTVDLSIEQALKIHSDEIIVCFGYANLTITEIVENYKKYDDTNWTEEKTAEAIYKKANRWLDVSNSLEKACEKYNIKYFDTGTNRKKVLNEAFKWIETQNSKD